MGSSGEAQSEARLEALLGVFERMRERPPRRTGDRLRPLLVTIGSARDNRSVTHQLVERCREVTGPCSHVQAGDPLEDVPLLLRHISRELADAKPRFEPALRFPLLSLALWFLELRRMRLRQAAGESADGLASDSARRNWQLAAQLTAASGAKARRALLAGGIRRRRQLVLPAAEPGGQGRLASILTYVEQLLPIGVALVALLSATAASTIDLAAAGLAAGFGLSFLVGEVVRRTRGRVGWWRYRWFRHQSWVGGAGTDLPGFALDVFFRPERNSDEELELLLVNAFLEDLRQAYRRDWRRATWARVRHPVVVIDALPEDHSARTFVRRVERVRRDTERFDPLLLVVGVGSQAQAAELARNVRVPVATDEPADLAGVAAAWDAYQADRRRVAVFGPRRVLQADVSAGDGSGTDPVYRPRRVPLPAHPFVPWLAMSAILVASLAVIVYEGVRFCDPHSVWKAPNGECIGITDGSHVFSEPRLSAVEKYIEQRNDEVIRSGRQYVTVIYLGAMTLDPRSPSGQADLQAGTHGELVGLAIAQEQHNRARVGPSVRVLLANAGSRFRYATRVAEEIRARAAADRSVVAVVGFGQSRRETSAAIEVLTRAALPMIGTTNTYDQTAWRPGQSDYSPYYFRLAPPNRRLAVHAAHWARTGRTGARATSAEVFYDASPDDLYSRNLAEDFRAAFGRNAVRMRPSTAPADVAVRVRQACGEPRPADVFYYAGRSDEFDAFITALSATTCGGGRRVVLGGDEVTKYVSDNGAEIGRNTRIRLFFTPLAAREAFVEKWVADQPAPRFYSEFAPMVDRLVGRAAPANTRPSLTHAALAYDAGRTVIGTVLQLSGEPTAPAVLATLMEPPSGPPEQGASGVLRFRGRANGHDVADKPVLLAAVQPDGRLVVDAVCGRLIDAQPHEQGCPPRQG
ncbi:hypothetical protein DPM19_06810 [Actinomadura craniellae]|uniref:Uncharacterized protein n=1 Tax=Actinomadura craniellae TaxID=2231787 RepID=A0A365H8Q5_9ACTN|nr:ABC transporter substrate-binding protein [Actinomadura craniellae]RAY15510.1 hypothetical protein DPM19_06810 [Actinomadura craniellae]